jgi:cell wall-associated NlpC family hydrolase
MNNLSRFIGIPFKNMGRTISGCDCWGLVVLIYKNYLNVELPTYSINQFDVNSVKEAFNSEKKSWVLVDKYKQFDIAELIIKVAKFQFEPLHVGIIVDNEYLLHTETNIGSHLVNLNDFRIKSRIKGFWRYKCHQLN